MERHCDASGRGGGDAFHVSQRRYWEGGVCTDTEPGRLDQSATGKPTITVGSLTLNNSMMEMMEGKGSTPEDNLAPLYKSLERGDFDLVAVGRAMIANPDWASRIREGKQLRRLLISMLHSLE